MDEVELLEANTHYAYVRHGNGREGTVSIRDLAPFREGSTTGNELEKNDGLELNGDMDASILQRVPEVQSKVGGEVVEVPVQSAHD